MQFNRLTFLCESFVQNILKNSKSMFIICLVPKYQACNQDVTEGASRVEVVSIGMLGARPPQEILDNFSSIFNTLVIKVGIMSLVIKGILILLSCILSFFQIPYQSLCLFVCLFLSLSLRLAAFLFACLSLFSVFQSVSRPICWSAALSMYPSTCQSVCLPSYLPINSTFEL